MFVATNYHSDRMNCLHLFILFYFMETVNQRSPSPVEFSSMDTLVLISIEKSGHCLILELGLCYIQNFFFSPNYFKIAKQAFFKQSWILSFSWCLF